MDNMNSNLPNYETFNKLKNTSFKVNKNKALIRFLSFFLISLPINALADEVEEWTDSESLNGLCSSIEENANAGYCNSWIYEVDVEPFDGEYGSATFDIYLARFDAYYNDEYSRLLIAKTVESPDFFYRSDDEDGYTQQSGTVVWDKYKNVKFYDMLDSWSTIYCINDDSDVGLDIVADTSRTLDSFTLECDSSDTPFINDEFKLWQYSPHYSADSTYEQNATTYSFGVSGSAGASTSGPNASVTASYSVSNSSYVTPDWMYTDVDWDYDSENFLRISYLNTQNYKDLIKPNGFGIKRNSTSIPGDWKGSLDNDALQTVALWRLDGTEEVGDNVRLTIGWGIGMFNYLKYTSDGFGSEYFSESTYEYESNYKSLYVDFDEWLDDIES